MAPQIFSVAPVFKSNDTETVSIIYSAENPLVFKLYESAKLSIVQQSYAQILRSLSVENHARKDLRYVSAFVCDSEHSLEE